MDFRSSENSAVCSISSKVLFGKSMCTMKLKNSAHNACESISVLSGKNLTSFTMFSIDGSASGSRSTTIRGFIFSKHRIKLLPYSSMKVYKYNHDLLNGILMHP